MAKTKRTRTPVCGAPAVAMWAMMAFCAPVRAEDNAPTAPAALPPQVPPVVSGPPPERAGEPAKAEHMRALLNNIWKDVNDVWVRLPGLNISAKIVPQLNIVAKVSGAHCYGIYISAGPVYCTGNGTVFASLDEFDRIAARFGAKADAGLAFLVAHEYGHHIQLINGRFGLVRQLIRDAPERRREISLRFELEADCLAGVWAARSRTFAAGAETRSDILSSLDAVGDDAAQRAVFGIADPSTFWHGSSAQRARWFMAGLEAGDDLEACNAISAVAY
jgi:uncharacterized protein